jgi:hypothetical protein
MWTGHDVTRLLVSWFRIGVNGVNMIAVFPRFAFFQILHWRIFVPPCLAGIPATHPSTQSDNGDVGLA